MRKNELPYLINHLFKYNNCFYEFSNCLTNTRIFENIDRNYFEKSDTYKDMWIALPHFSKYIEFLVQFQHTDKIEKLVKDIQLNLLYLLKNDFDNIEGSDEDELNQIYLYIDTKVVPFIVDLFTSNDLEIPEQLRSELENYSNDED